MIRPLSFTLALCVLAACANPAPPAVDAAMPVDAAANDAGMLCGSITSGRDPIPASCLPRCAAATFTAYRACRDVPCIMSALAADTTPPVLLGAGTSQVIVVACGPAAGVDTTCVQWQTLSVAATICPGSYDTWSNCRVAGGACDTEINALMSCAQADPGFTTMFMHLVSMCFASS
jgi:hypothetical protein